MKALIWFMECSIIFLAYNGKFGETVKCYHCEVENENCADPLNPEAEGVQICEGEFCIKSSTTYQGIPVAMRFCSDRARVDNSCVTEVVQGIPAEGCACSEDFCNGPPGTAVRQERRTRRKRR